MGYKFKIKYKKGCMNKAVDALSRREEEQASALEGTRFENPCDDASAVCDCALLTVAAHPVPHLLDLLRRETISSPEMWEITAAIKEGKSPPHLSLVDGLVYYKRRIYVSSRSEDRKPIMTEYHCSPSAGHPGYERTIKSIAWGFYWPNMRKEVRRLVEACVVCQTTKYSTQKPVGTIAHSDSSLGGRLHGFRHGLTTVARVYDDYGGGRQVVQVRSFCCSAIMV